MTHSRGRRVPQIGQSVASSSPKEYIFVREKWDELKVALGEYILTITRLFFGAKLIDEARPNDLREDLVNGFLAAFSLLGMTSETKGERGRGRGGERKGERERKRKDEGGPDP